MTTSPVRGFFAGFHKNKEKCAALQSHAQAVRDELAALTPKVYGALLARGHFAAFVVLNATLRDTFAFCATYEERSRLSRALRSTIDTNAMDGISLKLRSALGTLLFGLELGRIGYRQRLSAAQKRAFAAQARRLDALNRAFAAQTAAIIADTAAIVAMNTAMECVLMFFVMLLTVYLVVRVQYAHGV